MESFEKIYNNDILYMTFYKHMIICNLVDKELIENRE